MEICGVIAPRQADIVGERVDGYLAERVLPLGHQCDEHVVRTPEGRYIIWRDDFACGCCAPMEPDRCFTFGEITESAAHKIAAEEQGPDPPL